MSRLTRLAIATIVIAGSSVDRAAAEPVNQDRIISVRPAVPDGAKAFVAQQNKIEQDRQKKPLFGDWFKKKPSQQPVYGAQAPQPPKPASGKSFWDIFNPKKWGKGKQQTNSTPQQTPQVQQQVPQQTGWTQQGSDQSPAWNPPASGQPAPAEQMPPPNVQAPASQPG